MRLARRVALKFLPAEMSKDPQAVERFQRDHYYSHVTGEIDREVAQALTLGRSPELLVQAAGVLGLRGDAAQALALAEEAGRQMPSTHTLFHGVFLPVVRAEVESSGGAPARALETLKPAARHERGIFGAYGRYLRGGAHLAAGHAAEAAADFRDGCPLRRSMP